MCDNQIIRFEVNIEIVNGTKVARLRPVYPECPEDHSPIVAAAFLSLIFLGAFLLNLMVVVTVATSYTLKRYLYCHLLINLSLACLIDCFFNLSIAIGYVTTTPWRFGYAVSYFNSFTINMMNSEMAYAVLLLTVDRVAAVRKFTTYLTSDKYKLGIVISVTWVVAFLLASPLIGGYIGSMPYRRRYSCSMADPIDDYYLIPHLVLIVCVPTVVMVVLVCVTAITFHRKRKKQKKLKGNQSMGYFDQILMTPYFRDEFYPSVLVNCVVIAYVLAWLPFTALTTISPIMTQHWANDTSEDSSDDQFSRFVPSVRTNFKVTRAMLDESQLETLNSTNTSVTSSMSPDMSNFTMDEGLIPEILGTPAFDTVAVWLHFIFDVTVPILVFTILRDVRAKCEALIMCCRPNSVDVASPKPTRPLYINRLPSNGTSNKKEKTAKSKKKSKNSNKNMIDFKTPILFSTSEGLHIRTVEETYLGMMENKPLLGFNRQNNDPKFIYKICDVMLGHEDLTDFDGQFHIDDNYDFEKDPEAQDLGGSNVVVMGAQRVAMGQTAKSPIKSPTEDKVEEENVTFKLGYRPPTPPKVQIMGNEPAESIGDTIEPNTEVRRKKGKKIVRFASKLTEEIPRSSTPESSILNSSASSSRSDDSGIMADNERSSSQQGDEEFQKPRFTVGNNRPRVARKQPAKPGPKPRAPRRPAVPAKKNNSSSLTKPSKKVVGSKVRNIKSRHISSLNSSQTSPESKSPVKPRRFSKHSVQPARTKVAASTK